MCHSVAIHRIGKRGGEGGFLETLTKKALRGRCSGRGIERTGGRSSFFQSEVTKGPGLLGRWEKAAQFLKKSHVGKYRRNALESR